MPSNACCISCEHTRMIRHIGHSNDELCRAHIMQFPCTVYNNVYSCCAHKCLIHRTVCKMLELYHVCKYWCLYSPCIHWVFCLLCGHFFLQVRIFFVLIVLVGVKACVMHIVILLKLYRVGLFKWCSFRLCIDIYYLVSLLRMLRFESSEKFLLGVCYRIRVVF